MFLCNIYIYTYMYDSLFFKYIHVRVTSNVMFCMQPNSTTAPLTEQLGSMPSALVPVNI